MLFEKNEHTTTTTFLKDKTWQKVRSLRCSKRHDRHKHISSETVRSIISFFTWVNATAHCFLLVGCEWDGDCDKWINQMMQINHRKHDCCALPELTLCSTFLNSATSRRLVLSSLAAELTPPDTLWETPRTRLYYSGRCGVWSQWQSRTCWAQSPKTLLMYKTQVQQIHFNRDQSSLWEIISVTNRSVDNQESVI